jgi:hypothetical protein
VVQTVSILERLARREREARVRPSEDRVREGPVRPEAYNVRNTHLSDKVEPRTPGPGLDPAELTLWDADTRYVFEERLAVGLELGMAEGEARATAHAEASADHAKRHTPPANGPEAVVSSVDLAVLKLVAAHFKTDSPWKVWHSMGPSWQAEARRRVSEAMNENRKPTTGIFATPWNLNPTPRRTP